MPNTTNVFYLEEMTIKQLVKYGTMVPTYLLRYWNSVINIISISILVLYFWNLW